jgi:hypothetical protein
MYIYFKHQPGALNTGKLVVTPSPSGSAFSEAVPEEQVWSTEALAAWVGGLATSVSGGNTSKLWQFDL